VTWPGDDGPPDQLVSKAMMGGLLVDEIRLNLGEGIAGTVARTGEPLNIPEAYGDPRFNPDVDRRTGFHTRSILCVPIPDHSGRIMGVMQALNRRDGAPFDRDDEALLGVLAAYVGVSLENSKLYRSLVQQNTALLVTQRDLKERIDELDLLYQIEQESSAALDLSELLVRLCQRAVQLLQGEAGVVALRLPSGALDVTFYHRQNDEVQKTLVEHGEGLLCWAVQHRQSALSNDLAGDPRAAGRLLGPTGFPLRQVVAVPFDHAEAAAVNEDDDVALGAIAVLNKAGPQGATATATETTAGFDLGDLKLLALLAGQAARAIVLSRTRMLRIREGNLASIGRMLAGVMHDLRTPMTIVLGYAQLMATTEEADERTRFVRMVKKQFDLMQSMTGEVMAFARGESRLLLRRVLMPRFIEELKEQLQQELAPAEVELRIDAQYLGPAFFDELKLLRLVHNLARNAAQAMPKGGVFRIGIDVADAPPGEANGKNGASPHKGLFDPRREIVFTFSDTGVGLPEEVQAHLFEAFTSAGKDGGTGLGLAIVKKIVDDHKGRISVTTRPGEGTTFTVALPLSRE
jgi:signal transduction histidine kinase